MTDLIGGILLALGGGLQLAYALQLLGRRRTGRTDLPEIAAVYPLMTDTPAELAWLLARLD